MLHQPADQRAEHTLIMGGRGCQSERFPEGVQGSPEESQHSWESGAAPNQNRAADGRLQAAPRGNPKEPYVIAFRAAMGCPNQNQNRGTNFNAENSDHENVSLCCISQARFRTCHF